MTYINVRLALKGIVSKWDDLGEVLGLSHDEVESIEVNCSKDVKKCLKVVIGRGKALDLPLGRVSVKL